MLTHCYAHAVLLPDTVVFFWFLRSVHMVVLLPTFTVFLPRDDFMPQVSHAEDTKEYIFDTSSPIVILVTQDVTRWLFSINTH